MERLQGEIGEYHNRREKRRRMGVNDMRLTRKIGDGIREIQPKRMNVIWRIEGKFIALSIQCDQDEEKGRK